MSAQGPKRSMGLNIALLKQLREIRGRGTKVYDGVVGTPPGWLPEPLLAEFELLRNELLREHCLADVCSWLAAYRQLLATSDLRALAAKHNAGQLTDEQFREHCQLASRRRGAFFPPEYRRELRDLAYIQDIVELGETDGIAAYLGTGAYKAVRGMAIETRLQENRQKGTAESARARRQRSENRDRKIREAFAAETKPKKTPKRIADDSSIFDISNEKDEAAHRRRLKIVYRVLKSSRVRD